MADTNLNADLNILQNAPIEIELIDDDLNIIQKLDDEPNDVGGLTSAELKEHFDRAGNIIKDYINNELIPAVVASDATEQAREAAESERESAEGERAAAEAVRVERESARYTNEGIRDAQEGMRMSAEDARVSADATRTSNENARVSAETARANSEANRVSAESARASAETQRVSAETSRASAESTRVSNEQTRVSAESARISAESARASAEASRNTAEQARATAETARETFVNGFKSSVESLNGIVKADGSGNLSAAVEGTDYMGAVNPTCTGSFSMNRRAGEEIGKYSHAEGYNTIASHSYSHAEGYDTRARNLYAHAEGSHATASGKSSHAEGDRTIAIGNYSHAQGKYNVEDTAGAFADIVGWGTADNERKNISSLTTGGDLHLAGDVYVHAADDGTGGTKLGTGGGGEPATYIKSASVSGNTLTLTKKDDTAVTFTPTGGEPELFYCEYGVTAFSDISNALSDGLFPVCLYDNLCYVYTGISNGYHCFTSVASTTAYRLYVKTTWGNASMSLGSYSKPTGGIPKTDLASAVQTSLGKADTALQAHQDISGKQDVISDLSTIRSNASAGASKISCTDAQVGSYGYIKLSDLPIYNGGVS